MEEAMRHRIYHPDSFKVTLNGLVRRKLVEHLAGPGIGGQRYRLTPAGVDLQQRCFEQPALVAPGKNTLRHKIIDTMSKNGSQADVIFQRVSGLQDQRSSVRVTICRMVDEGFLKRAKPIGSRSPIYHLMKRGEAIRSQNHAILAARLRNRSSLRSASSSARIR
jgi:hypothetical protein